MSIAKNTDGKVMRQEASKLSVEKRIGNFDEFKVPQSDEAIGEQANRCMDCGIAYCNYACPLGNVLPDLNALVANENWEKALEILEGTNNFPEITGRLCPALCEGSCAMGINDEPVITKEIELAIAEKGFKNNWIVPKPANISTGYKIAVIGSGPSGLAVSQNLVRKGHQVTVYEKSKYIGGLLASGIPNYKLDKKILDRRIDQLKKEGIQFKTNITVGVDLPTDEIYENYDAICLCGGSSIPRNLDVKGRSLDGIHYALEYLERDSCISAKGKNVVIIGGGDTGADCLGTAVRQCALEVHQIELMPKPPLDRIESMPWPTWPMVFRKNTSHEEGGEPEWSVGTKYFSGKNGQVEKIHCSKLEWVTDSSGKKSMKEIEDEGFEIEVDLVLFAMGFVHPEYKGMLADFDVAVDGRGNVIVDEQNQTNIEKIYAAGDMHVGQSLICTAIADGRQAADRIHNNLIK